MSDPETSMTSEEWRALALLCEAEANRYSGGNYNREREARFSALRAKCIARQRALVEGRVMP